MLFVALSAACIVPNPNFNIKDIEDDSGTDGDADGDIDGDIDGDADGDIDGDADGDTDGDTDGDVDGDTDSDADGDADGDIPPPELVRTIGSTVCGDGTSVSLTIPTKGVATGHTISLRFSGRGIGTGLVNASDSRGNIYDNDASALGSSSRVDMLSTFVATELVEGDVITVTHPDASSVALVAEELTGVVDAHRVITYDWSVGVSSNPTVTVMVGEAPALLIAGITVWNDRACMGDAGWTELGSHSLIRCGSPPFPASSHGAWRTITSTGSYEYSPSLSAEDTWAVAVVAYSPP